MTLVEGTKTHAVHIFAQQNAHGCPTILEQPGVLRNATEELCNQLFPFDIVRQMRDEVQVGDYNMATNESKTTT